MSRTSDRSSSLLTPVSVAGDGGSEANYRVVDTDYENYAIVYNCKSILGFLKKGERFF